MGSCTSISKSAKSYKIKHITTAATGTIETSTHNKSKNLVLVHDIKIRILREQLYKRKAKEAPVLTIIRSQLYQRRKPGLEIQD